MENFDRNWSRRRVKKWLIRVLATIEQWLFPIKVNWVPILKQKKETFSTTRDTILSRVQWKLSFLLVSLFFFFSFDIKSCSAQHEFYFCSNSISVNAPVVNSHSNTISLVMNQTREGKKEFKNLKSFCSASQGRSTIFSLFLFLSVYAFRFFNGEFGLYVWVWSTVFRLKERLGMKEIEKDERNCGNSLISVGNSSAVYWCSFDCFKSVLKCFVFIWIFFEFARDLFMKFLLVLWVSCYLFEVFGEVNKISFITC